MEFFTSTGFYCLAIVTAIALLGMLLHPAQIKPAETYIMRAMLMPDDAPCNGGSVTISVAADGSITLKRRGITAPPDTAINLVADVRGDKVKIIEKLAMPQPIGHSDEPLIASAQLHFIGSGRWAIRYESEVTGTWCTLSLLNAEGYSTTAEMRY